MPRKYSMDVRREEAANRRRRLLDAAIEVLGEVGAERLTMEMVAERADTATRTLYNHFTTREELLAAAHARLLESFREAVPFDELQQGEPSDRLRRFVTVLYDNYQHQGDSLTTLLGVDDPKIAAQLRDMRQWRREQLQLILRARKDSLRMPLAEATAFAFIMTNHVSWRVLTDELGMSQAKAIETTITALEGGLFNAGARQPRRTTRRARSA